MKTKKQLIVLFFALFLIFPSISTAKIDGWTEAEMETLFDTLCPLQTGVLTSYGWWTNSNALVLNKLDATAAPTVNNDVDEGYAPGSLWIDVTNDVFYICVDATDGDADWSEGGGTGGSTTEVQDETFSKSASDGDTTHAASQDALWEALSEGLTIDPDDLADGDCVRVGKIVLVAGETITLTSYNNRRPHVYMKYDGSNAGGRVFIFNPDSTDTDNETYPFLGYATSSAATGADVEVAVQGVICRADAVTTWTGSSDEGTPLYASPSGAGLSGAASDLTFATGDKIQRTGIILRVNGYGGTGDVYLETYQYLSIEKAE